MEITSSHKQELINYAIKYSLPCLIVVLLYLAFSYAMGYMPSNVLVSQLKTYVLVMVCFPFAFWVWYHLIGKGLTKTGIVMVSSNSERLTIDKYGSRYSLLWSNIEGYAIKGYVHKIIKIISNRNTVIDLDYYWFTSSQRQMIFHEIERRING